MEIKFEWHTTKITEDQKKKAEEELTNKINHDYDQTIKIPASLLIVSLFDENPKYLLTGAAISVEGETTKEVIKKITYNPGIHFEFINP
ncbi:MAG: hypothetical protein JRE47_14015 [Deltaproteobacteria bacterium]|nr:hypothetical protein [Deltaproteobacteria bacterium]